MDYSIFDILGPIMIGPSSSHTAGACRISKTARDISGSNFIKIKYYLHGSFAETYRGHGTDKALLAGSLGMNPDDERIRDSYRIAQDRGIEFEFVKMDLGDVHPNTTRIEMTYEDGTVSNIMGSSIGGGNIEIIEVDNVKMKFVGDKPTLLLKYHDEMGIIAFISSVLTENNYNIESMRTTNKVNGDVILVLELDKSLHGLAYEILMKDKRFVFAKYIEVRA